jgi:hypothetical protein
MRYSALPYPMILKPDIVLARHTYVTGRGRLGVRSISSGDSLSGKDSHLTEIDFFLAQVFPSLDASQHPRQDSNAMEMPSLPSQKVQVLDAPRLRTRGELTASEEATRFGCASWAIQGLFTKLTDCGDAS